MKRYVPVIFAVFLLAFVGLAQTTYLGNILQMHRQVEPLPAPSLYEGSIVYNRDAGALYFSNGTIWAPIAGDAGAGSGSGGGVNYWVDGGFASVFDGGLNGFFASPTSLQVRIGAQVPEPYTGRLDYAPGNPLIDAVRNSALYVFGQTYDAGAGVWSGAWTPITAHTRHAGDISRQNFLTVNSDYRGANLYVFSDRWDGGELGTRNYAQIAFEAANGTGSATEGSTITEYNTGSTIGSDGAFARGLNIHSSNYLTFSAGANSGSYPAMFIAPNGQVAMGWSDLNFSTSLTVDQNGFGTGIFVKNSFATGFGFANNGTDLDLGGGTYDYLESDGTRVSSGDLTNGGLNAANYRVAGNSDATTTVTSATTGNGGIGFNQASGTLYMMATNKEARPLKSGPEWVLDGRTATVEVQFEQTVCPVLRNTLVNSAGGSIVVGCTDDVAATATTGAGFPARAYRNFIANTTVGDRAIFTSGTPPAIGATWACTTGGGCFIQRGSGPIMRFWMRVNQDWSTNTLFYAGMGTALPTAGQPATASSSVYLRYDRTVDSTFAICATDGSARTCTSASTTAPANGTEYQITIDCAESSTSCYLYINGSYQAAVSANLPSTSAWMGIFAANQFVATSLRSFGLGRLSVTME